MQIFMDGSGIEGKIGVAATTVDKKDGRKMLRYRLGQKGHHTVYEAELVGIILATHMARKKGKLKKLSIYTDNQATIKALKDKTNTPRTYLIQHIITAFKRLHKKNKDLQIELRWVPGHEGVIGNKKADEGAKKAAKEGSSQERDLPKEL